MNATQTLDGGLQLTHYGAAAWRITDGKRTLLLDPYFTRLRYTGRFMGMADSPTAPGDERPVFGPDDIIQSDTDLVDKHIEAADLIVISHSHFNHCMDMPHIAKKHKSLVMGTESTTNMARANGVDDDQLLTVRGGEDYEFDEFGFSVRAVPSLHSPLLAKRYYEAGTIPRGISTPLLMCEYCEGGTLGYFVRWGEHRILMFGSMNYIERELYDLNPTMVLVAAAEPRLHIHEYTSRMLNRLNHPPVVVATHWDTQAFPYGASQEKALKQAESFIAEVKAVSPDAEVVLPLHFDTIHVDAKGKVLRVEPGSA
jgi:L-ascorbate metabolism protein UlaG (beta-lactamase superfamily)